MTMTETLTESATSDNQMGTMANASIIVLAYSTRIQIKLSAEILNNTHRTFV